MHLQRAPQTKAKALSNPMCDCNTASHNADSEQPALSPNGAGLIASNPGFLTDLALLCGCKHAGAWLGQGRQQVIMPHCDTLRVNAGTLSSEGGLAVGRSIAQLQSCRDAPTWAAQGDEQASNKAPLGSVPPICTPCHAQASNSVKALPALYKQSSAGFPQLTSSGWQPIASTGSQLLEA